MAPPRSTKAKASGTSKPAAGAKRPAAGRNTTAERAVDVLLLFTEQAPVLTASEVAKRLGHSRSTTYRYLQSLRSYGLLEENGQGGFRLGPRIFELARAARSGMRLPDIALPVMRQLASDVGEAVLLTQRMGNQVVCIEMVASAHPIRISYERWQVLPIHAGASAKVLLAFAPPEEIDRVLGTARFQRFTERTVISATEMRSQLAKIRRQGYSFSDGELDEGVRGIAAPIFFGDGRTAGGLSIAGPAFRITDEALPGMIDAVRAAAADLSDRLSLVSE